MTPMSSVELVSHGPEEDGCTTNLIGVASRYLHSPVMEATSKPACVWERRAPTVFFCAHACAQSWRSA